jgi:antitoxin VapB
MIHLSRKTEALARRLAAARGLTVEEAITQALEQSARDAGVVPDPRPRDQSAEAVALRRARIDQIVDEIAAMPILDPRFPREIMGDLNAL